MLRTGSVLLGCLLWAATSLADPAVWQVKGRDNTLYLLGTIHMLPADEQLADSIQQAYQHARQLVMEVDMDDMDPAITHHLMMELGRLPPGKSLFALLDAETRRQLQITADTLGIDSQLLTRFQPWLAAITLEQIQLTRMGFAAEGGIEMQLTQRALQDHKAIQGLETLKQQLNLFAQMDMRTQQAYLRQTLDELQEPDEDLPALLQAWRTGNIPQLQILMRQSFDASPELMTRLLTERNQRWLQSIKSLLDKQSDDYLVAVGALHLVGEQGLVSLLRQAGYQVTLQ